jgi:hypothetical protein
VSAVGVLAMTMGPAAAAPGAAVGAVNGTVSLSPGLGGGGPTNPLICAHQNFAFAPISIAGAIVAAPAVGAGTIVTGPVNGGSTGTPLPAPLGCPAGQENLLSANGAVNAFTFAGGGVGSVTGGCAGGTYTRIGGAVLVLLSGCSASVTSPTGSATTAFPVIAVPAWFQPDNTAENGVTNPFTHAIFTGLFLGAGT